MRRSVAAALVGLFALAACSSPTATSSPSASASATTQTAALKQLVLEGRAAGLEFYPTDIGQLMPAVATPRADQSTVPRNCNQYLTTPSDNYASVGSNENSTVVSVLFAGRTMYDLTAERIQECPEIVILRSNQFYAETTTTQIPATDLPADHEAVGFTAVTTESEGFAGAIAEPAESVQIVGLVADTTIIVEVLGHNQEPSLSTAIEAFEAQAAKVSAAR